MNIYQATFKIAAIFNTAAKEAINIPVPNVEQSHSMCGPAALLSVLKYFGIEKTEEEVKRLSGATIKDGVDAVGLGKAAKK
jgi:predicted double-glycine peptidase